MSNTTFDFGEYLACLDEFEKRKCPRGCHKRRKPARKPKLEEIDDDNGVEPEWSKQLWREKERTEARAQARARSSSRRNVPTSSFYTHISDSLFFI